MGYAHVPEEKKIEAVTKVKELSKTMSIKDACKQAGIKYGNYYDWTKSGIGKASKKKYKKSKIKQVDINSVLANSQPQENTDITVTVLKGNSQSVADTLSRIFGG